MKPDRGPARAAAKTLITIAVIFTVLYLLISLSVALSGSSIARMSSGSMSPQYPTGSLIVIKEAALTDFKPTDLIAFKTRFTSLTMHRVQSVSPTGEITTKGDHRDEADPTQLTTEDTVYQVLFANHLAGYLWVLAPWLVAGIALSGLFGFLISTRSTVVSLAYMMVTLALVLGVRSTTPFLILEIASQGQTIDARPTVDVINAGIATVQVVSIDGEVDQEPVLAPGESAQITGVTPESTIKLNARAQIGVAQVVVFLIPVLVALLALGGSGAAARRAANRRLTADPELANVDAVSV